MNRGEQWNLSRIKPTISVLILTFNQVEFIERALRSVVDQLSDEYDIEIVITDDGSLDGTCEAIERFVESSPVPVTFLAKDHQGVSAIAGNLLTMINLAQGDFISFLAGDDYFVENRFDLQLDKFFANPNLKISYSDGINCIAGKLGNHCHPDDMVSVMSSGNPSKVHQYITSRTPALFIQGVLAKTEFLKKIQPFDTDLIADDWVFNIKVFKYMLEEGGQFDFQRRATFIRNIHSDNTSKNLVVHYERVRQVAERYCKSSRRIKAKFIGKSLLLSLKRKNIPEISFFLKKTLSIPESIYWLFAEGASISWMRIRRL